ncbi:MAG TPA: hypothetical protein VIO60_03185, partial [Rectinemataceae bacterium]
MSRKLSRSITANPLEEAGTGSGVGGEDRVLRSIVEDFVGARAEEYDAVARDIWEHPEVAFAEERSARVYRERLASRGFAVTEYPEMPNSFVAEKTIGAGGGATVSGKKRNAAGDGAGSLVKEPIIGFMGEYDALPGMSQACDIERRPETAGAPGHACGHNLLGAGSLVAAEALAHLLESRGISGIVRYYGCPAEESLGRIPIVKAGRFDDCSAVLTWHPADVNTPHRYLSSANLAAVFSFKGRASHAGM